MANTARQIRALAERIEALPPKDQVKLFDVVLTPAMRMRLLAERITEHELSERLSVSDAADEVAALGRSTSARNEALDKH